MSVRRLDPVLIDQIAAGEVIDRPASAVKELVENALDAGATRIDVLIEAGGRKRIRVADNGSGMSAEDLGLAVLRHATSKLPEGRLDRIETLGFRGEALPSIGSVARLTVTTRAAGQDAWQIRVDAGRQEPLRPAALGGGTRIEVEDLFFATPARLKFLKGDRAEAQAALQVIKRLAMAHPAVRFSVAGDHLSGLELPVEAGEEALARRIGAIMGRDFVENAAPVLGESGVMRLSGLASLPTFTRASAVDQFLFVNGRPVRDKLLVGALRAAYADAMGTGRYPAVALFLELDPASVDVNVHPAKLEVRFREGEVVRGLIICGIRDALAGAGHRASSLGGAGMLARLASQGITQFRPRESGSLEFWRPTETPAASGEGFREANSPPHLPRESEPAAGPASFPEQVPEAEFPLGHARAQFHENYILAQTRDGVVIVDQHAAHERLVYERLKTARAHDGITRQALLIPAVLEMGEDAMARLLDAEAMLERAGLVIEAFGPGAVLVREVPAALAHADIGKLVRDLADRIADWGGSESLEARLDLVLKTIACHHSIRSGRRLRLEEMDALLREMEATPGSGQCNHGRPTYVALKLAEIETLFGRR